MGEEDILQAAAARLGELWPGRPVYVGQVPRGAQEGFTLRAGQRELRRGLDRQRTRSVELTVGYCRRDGDELTWSAWLEEMLERFDRLEWQGRTLRVEQARGSEGQAEGYCTFTCLVRLHDWAEEDQTGEGMERLEQRLAPPADDGKDG